MAGEFSDLLKQFAAYDGDNPPVNATLELTFGNGFSLSGWPNDRNNNTDLSFKNLWAKKFANEGILLSREGFPFYLGSASEPVIDSEETYPLGNFEVSFTTGAQGKSYIPEFVLVSPLTITVSAADWYVSADADQSALNALTEGATGSNGALTWKVTNLGVSTRDGVVYLDENKSDDMGVDPELANQIATATLKMDLHASRDFGSILSEYGHPTPKEITVAALDTVPTTGLKRKLEKLIHDAITDELYAAFDGLNADWKVTGLAAKNVSYFQEVAHSTLSPQGASDTWYSTTMSFACTVSFNATALSGLGLNAQSTSGSLPTKIEGWDPQAAEFSLEDITVSAHGGNQ
ncbi:MAG: hypothetical protein IIZ04_03865 [Aeriscardovia sp.]|nr:hypothetical protein [Aeriscardovia sp.]